MKNNNTRKLAIISISLALAIILQLIESVIPIPIPVPGVKLGLANLVALVLVVKVGTKEAVAVNLLRVIIASLLRGTLFGPPFYLGMAGALVSSLVMVLAFKSKTMTMFGVSAMAAGGHAVGQMIATVFIFGTVGMLYYMPILIALSAISGLFIGFLAASTLRNTRHIKI